MKTLLAVGKKFLERDGKIDNPRIIKNIYVLNGVTLIQHGHESENGYETNVQVFIEDIENGFLVPLEDESCER